MSCFGGCFGRHAPFSLKRDEWHTPAPSSYLAPSRTAEWSSLSTPQADKEGYSSPNAQSVAASTVCSFYSAVSRYTDAAEEGEDFDGGAQSRASEKPRPRLPKAPASVRRFLNFDKEDIMRAVDEAGEEAGAAAAEVVPATPSVVAAQPASPAASSITGPPSPSRGAEGGAKPAESAVPSHPLNVDEEDEEAGEEAATAAPPPALIPARAATAGSDALPPLHAASSVDLGLADKKKAATPSSPARESAKSTEQQPGLWSRVFSKKSSAAAATAKPAPLVPAAAPASLPSPAASTTAPPAVTHLTASGPAGSAAAVEAPARKGIFGW